MNPLDLWVKTNKGLVRADQIVHISTHSGGALEVTLSLIETVGARDVGDVAQVVHTVGKLNAKDGTHPEDAFAGFIARHRATPRRGVVFLSDDGHLGFYEFPSLDAHPDRLPRPSDPAPSTITYRSKP